jgi:hypothetical protein
MAVMAIEPILGAVGGEAAAGEAGGALGGEAGGLPGMGMLKKVPGVSHLPGMGGDKKPPPPSAEQNAMFIHSALNRHQFL